MLIAVSSKGSRGWFGGGQIADDARYAAEVRRRARTIAEQLGGCTVIGLQETGRPADAGT